MFDFLTIWINFDIQSSICRRHRRTGTRVHISFRPVDIYHSPGLHSQWFSPLDIIFIEWCALLTIWQLLGLADIKPAATIAQLRARKQRYKLAMFTKLYRILLLTVVIIFIFFVISTLSFSDRLAEGKPAWVEYRV